MSAIIVEKWKVYDNPNGDLLQIAYTPEQFGDSAEMLMMFRESMAERHKCRLGI